jgi:pimeloyl-ACP methyl ester carboxylesterase
MRAPAEPPPTVSARWLLTAFGVAILAAAACAWGALCLLFWQGSWQLLYHPEAAVKRTPASVGVAFEPVAFAATEAGQARLTGWWIAAEPGARYERFTVLFLHGQNGNLGDTVEALAALHRLGLNVLAFDYRGYGQSLFARPSEARWKEDAGWALEYLTGTRHIAAGAIILDGEQLGANLALETAALHPELAGLILLDPIPDAARMIFQDARARLVPAHLLVQDRYDLEQPSIALRIPSQWLVPIDSPPSLDMVNLNSAFKQVSARKLLLWMPGRPPASSTESDALSRLLGDLPTSTR